MQGYPQAERRFLHPRLQSPSIRTTGRCKVISVTLSDGETVEFNRDHFVMRETPEGYAVTPKPGHEAGFLRLFFPWAEIRQIKES